MAIERIGKYEIQALIGRGGFGTVYRAFDSTIGRAVAVKILPAGTDAEVIARFSREAAAAGNLHHSNIITIYDFGEQEGQPYLVMELVEGEDLRTIIRSKSLPLLKKVDILTQTARGLAAAHAA